MERRSAQGKRILVRTVISTFNKECEHDKFTVFLIRLYGFAYGEMGQRKAGYPAGLMIFVKMFEVFGGAKEMLMAVKTLIKKLDKQGCQKNQHQENGYDLFIFSTHPKPFLSLRQKYKK